MKKAFILFCILLMVPACGLFKKKKPPPPPEPTWVLIEFEAAGNINPNSAGRASPLVIRVYQLRSYSAFEKADFFLMIL